MSLKCVLPASISDDHERRPSLGDNFSRLGNGAELAITHHAGIIPQIEGSVAPIYGLTPTTNIAIVRLMAHGPLFVK